MAGAVFPTTKAKLARPLSLLFLIGSRRGGGGGTAREWQASSWLADMQNSLELLLLPCKLPPWQKRQRLLPFLREAERLEGKELSAGDLPPV